MIRLLVRFSEVSATLCVLILVAPMMAIAAPSALPMLYASPGAVIENNPTMITFTISIADLSLIKQGVNLQSINQDNSIVSITPLYDDGTHGDTVANDGVFTGQLVEQVPPDSVVRLRASAAFRGVLKRVFSPAVTIAALPSLTVMNASRDFAGDNMGSQIYLHWNDMPDNTAFMRLYRSGAALGPWQLLVQQPLSADSPTSIADTVDGGLQDWYYRLEIYDNTWTLLKMFAILRVPKDSPPCPASSQTLPWNSEFISNDKFTDAGAMTREQIQALLKYYGSVLSQQHFVDNDGAAIDPAGLIHSAAVANGINPQVLLTTLQKESSLVKSSTNWAHPPHDGYFGVKISNCTTFRCQLGASASTLASAYDAALNGGTTSGGWTVGHSHNVYYSGNLVSPGNAATTSLFNYTPVIGSYWNADANLGVSSFVNIWENGLFNNLVFALKWVTNGKCDVSGTDVYVGGHQSLDVSAQQPSNVHGATAKLPDNNNYRIRFGYDLNTWDSFGAFVGGNTGYWDSFSVSVLDKPYWDEYFSDPVNMPFLWGGAQYGTYTQNRSNNNSFTSIRVPQASINYINAVLDTATEPYADANLPSWGVYSILDIKSGTCVHINDAP